VVAIDEELEVKILRVDIDDRKIGLSLKRAQWGDSGDLGESGGSSDGGGMGGMGGMGGGSPSRGGMDDHGSMGTDKISL